MRYLTASATTATRDPALIRRVNQLYHDLTHDSFDDEHRCRHRVEKPFWRQVGWRVLGATPTRAQERIDNNNMVGRVIVDLACGSGFVAESLRPWLRAGDRLTGLDLCESSLRTTARKWSEALGRTSSSLTLQPVAADGQSLPLRDGCADLLTINAGLHHLPEPLTALREIDRVLKPGGFFALGFEPNRHHFESPGLLRVSRSLAMASWYASPRQNWRRFRRRLVHAPAPGAGRKSDHDVLDDVCGRMNSQLLHDGLVSHPLSTRHLLDLVDPHARGSLEPPGFDPWSLLGQVMPEYGVHLLFSSDYLGEGARRLRPVRLLADAMLRMILPRHGSLFSWLIRKPVRSTRQARGLG